jgi:Na+/H+ antiporter NhaD/arsenite permease-like protein
MILILTILFLAGYTFIALEHVVKVSKSASALFTGVVCWIVYAALAPEAGLVVPQLTESVGELSGILFFLMGAMTIVELIDMHDGFRIVTSRITTRNRNKLLWIVSLVAFLLSSVLDNLTTTIVMVSLLGKMVEDRSERAFFASMVVIAANAGGVWTPIGDVTTTMLWIGNRISSLKLMAATLLPSLMCAAAPLCVVTLLPSRQRVLPGGSTVAREGNGTPAWQRHLVFFGGVGVLIAVPVFKAVTHLPPYMGALLGLAVLWTMTAITDRLPGASTHEPRSVTQALQRIDMSSILFFLGILLSIAALQHAGVLALLARGLDKGIHNVDILAFVIGLISAVVDNVPLVAGSMGMYDLARFPMDHPFWLFLSYCAGTGGSILVFGSAAGVVAMGMAKIEFFWYLKRIAPLALLGYVAGAGVYLLSGIMH